MLEQAEAKRLKIPGIKILRRIVRSFLRHHCLALAMGEAQVALGPVRAFLRAPAALQRIQSRKAQRVEHRPGDCDDGER